MDSYKRFGDENYRNWLQAAESLHILRSQIRDFVENETEKYHRSLRERLKDDICESKCQKLQTCEKCKQWKNAILHNHNHKNMIIHWSNCQPYLWSKDKWEVAKVYMLRGIKNHHSFDQFDISAILNFMYHCKHFKPFADGQYLTKVINVRNKVMHSPDFRLSKEEMDESLKNVQQLAKILENHAPGLKNVSKQMQQFSRMLEKCSGQVSQNTSNSNEETLKLLDKEQHALKEKIECLARCYEDDQVTELKLQEELQGIKNFLDQNKDLLENLGPQVNRLHEIQEKVNKHEQDINNLDNRVDRLENIAPDPLFTGDPLKFKNHVFEEARRRNMPEPEFTEKCEANGYRGIVNVNGLQFEGLQVCNNKKNAHQEVAKKVLEYMTSHPEWKEETTAPTLSIPSSASSSSPIYYGIVTVVLNNQYVVSDEFVQEGEAIESAYMKLANRFGLTSFEAGITYKTAVQKHFTRCNFPLPMEQSIPQDDKTLCKLLISGSFTFYDKDGSSKKKQAEHQAAKVALQYLSGFLNCTSKPKADENYKGFLKEHLEALGLTQPDYNDREGITEKLEGATRSEDNLHSVISKNDSVTRLLDLPTADTVNADKCLMTETLDSSSSEMPSQSPKGDSTGTTFYGIVTVTLNNQEVMSDGCVQKEEAIQSAYRKLACQFGLTLEGQPAVLEHFRRCNFPVPKELILCEDNKIFCKLQLTGDFTFADKDGSSKKKQAEQQAAKIALQHLSGLLNRGFEAEVGKNYKVLLKEHLDAVHLKSPVYRCKENGEIIEEMEAPSTSEDNLDSNCMTAISDNYLQPKERVSQTCLVTDTKGASTPDVPNKSPNMDYTEINTLLNMFHLKPPSVTVESASTKKSFSCRVSVNLDKFIFQNNNDYTVKRDAIRETYLLFGNALGIAEKLDKTNASMFVKQDFSQKSLTLPKEVFENNKCSLNEITYNLVYDGTGSSEAEAKQDALQKALATLSLLNGFKSLPKCSTVKETEDQVNTLLGTKNQKELVYLEEQILYKSSVELLFSDYTMESKHEKKKKENVNHLSSRILGLLAVEPEPNTVSLRNCLDECFKQKNLKQPIFDNTEEAHGSKVTFSVKVSCLNPNWEDSIDVAEKKMVDELKKRLQYLAD